MKQMLIGLLCLLLSSNIALAHSVNSRTFTGGYGIHIWMGDGDPMAFADVQLFAPDNADAPYQEGLTDRNGCFVFRPSGPGAWTVKANDGMGHAITSIIQVEAVDDHDDAGHHHGHDHHHHDHHHHDHPDLHDWLAGIGIIFGIFGLWAMFSKQGRKCT